MANNVFANGMELACKAGSGKTICAFPDVCFTPPDKVPPTPPGIPIPYPNTGSASDTTKGSKKVKISNKEIMLKNKSYFKKSMGDEAGAAQKKGVLTSKNTGKVYFNAWSMDVKVEGKNVDRHLDLTTNNHASVPGDTPVWPYLDSMSTSLDHPCVADQKKEYEACKNFAPHKEGGPDPCPPKPAAGKPSTDGPALAHASDVIADRNGAGACNKARRCALKPYKPTSKQASCCPGQTPHHLVEASAFHFSGRGESSTDRKLFNCNKYNTGKAPSICVEGTGHGVGTHGLMHTFQSSKAAACKTGVVASPPLMKNTKVTTVKQAQKDGAAAVGEVFPESGCNPDCIEAQLSAYHEKECGMDDPTPIKAVKTCDPTPERMASARATVASRQASGGSSF